MKKLKKILGTALFFIVCFFAGGLMGIGMSRGDFSFFELIFALFVGYNISIIIHEGGHLVFGLLSGYGFSSFRVWSLMLLKVEGRFSLRTYKLAGTGGQCLMTPPEGDDREAPVILYNLGGVIFNLILSLVCICVFLAFPNVYLLSCTLITTAILSALTLLTNGIPLNIGGIANDGMNALSLTKDRDAKVAFLNQLRMNEAQTRGIRLCDMPESWFEIPEGVDRKNTAFSSMAVFAVNRSFDKKDMKLSEGKIEELLNSDWNIIGLHRNLLKCDLAFCKLINYGREADVSPLQTPEMQNFMKSMKNFPSVIRTEYAMALIHDNSDAEAEKKLMQFEKIAKTSPHPADIASEREFIDMAKSKAESIRIMTSEG